MKTKAPEFTPGFYSSSCYWVFSFMYMFCRSLFVLLSPFFLLVFNVFLRFTDSDYLLGIFKLFIFSLLLRVYMIDEFRKAI